MQSNIAQALAYIDQDEGPELNIASSEPGGSSKHGVSMMVLREWHAEHGLPAPTMDDMRAVDSALAGKIYAARFADPIHFDELAGGVDYRLLDIAVNLGVTGGIRALQRALNIAQSGKMDAATVKAAITADPATLIKALGTTWLAIKREGGGWSKYGPGWTNRASFIVVHNTSAPDLKKWAEWQTRKPPIDGPKVGAEPRRLLPRPAALVGGPHLFVTPAGILAFSPLTGPGTHSPAWNSISMGRGDRWRVRA
jgi:lysozyme family protein